MPKEMDWGNARIIELQEKVAILTAALDSIAKNKHSPGYEGAAVDAQQALDQIEQDWE